jgi:hypothetical protein
MTLFRSKSIFACETEATPGTAETLAAADAAYNVFNFDIQPTVTMTERPGQGGTGNLASIPAGIMGTATFRTEMPYNGTDIPNWASILFPACGVVGSSGVFKPLLEAPGANVKTLTIAKYMDGKRRQLRGCMGTFQFLWTTGELAYIDWTFTGIWDGETAQSMLTPTYPSVPPLRVAGGATTFASVAACMQSLTFNIGNVVTGLQCNNGSSNTSGFEYFMVSRRTPTITGDPQSKLIATQDRMNQMLTSVEAAFSVSIAAPSASAITLAAPRAQIVSNTEAEREGIAIDQITWQCNQNGSTQNDEFSITFS